MTNAISIVIFLMISMNMFILYSSGTYQLFGNDIMMVDTVLNATTMRQDKDKFNIFTPRPTCHRYVLNRVSVEVITD